MDEQPAAGCRSGEARLHVVRFGMGRRLFVGLHGWSGSHRTYEPLAAHLPPEASLFAPDLPGFGASPVPRPLSLERIVAPIVELLDGLPSPGATLVGNCTGALLALLVAQQRPEAVERLVLVDPFAYVPWYLRPFLLGRVGRWAYLATFANPVGRWLTNGALARHRTGATDLTAGFTAVDHEVTLAYLRLLAGLGGVERFAGVGAPIDLAVGERTFGAVRRSVARWRAILPRARLIEIPGAGHLPLAEAPERVAAAVFAPPRPGPI